MNSPQRFQPKCCSVGGTIHHIERDHHALTQPWGRAWRQTEPWGECFQILCTEGDQLLLRVHNCYMSSGMIERIWFAVWYSNCLQGKYRLEMCFTLWEECFHRVGMGKCPGGKSTVFSPEYYPFVCSIPFTSVLYCTVLN